MLIERLVRQKIASELFDRKLIERHVAIEGVDDPVAISPNLAIVVEVNAVRIRIARGIEPISPTVLTPVFRSEQFVDQLFVRIVRFVIHELFHNFNIWRQAGDVEACSSS